MALNNLIASKVEYGQISGFGFNPGTTGETATIRLESIISNIIGFLSVIAVIYFVFQIILAGYAFLSSRGDEKKMMDARSRLTNGILGLTIVIVALGLAALLASLLGLESIFNLNETFKQISP